MLVECCAREPWEGMVLGMPLLSGAVSLMSLGVWAWLVEW